MAPPDSADVQLTVVIPAYQAGATIGDVVTRARAAVPAAAITVVDDGSTDATAAAARAAGASLVSHPRNRGKGVALGTGIAQALDSGAAVIVTLDADGQHAPESIPTVAGPVLAGAADIALGARPRIRPMPLRRQLTNWVSARLVGVSDAQTGFRAFTAEVARRIRPAERHYDFETAFLLDALAAGYRVTSVPIPTVYIAGARSHFRPWADTWRLARVFSRHARRILGWSA
ncbi:MAG: glycosyltransferase family 2 protein [Gemmatimonadales bacterium]|nr:glycosyltransferase family 2 protein [Gemmatimonadales bacterium]